MEYIEIVKERIEILEKIDKGEITMRSMKELRRLEQERKTRELENAAIKKAAKIIGENIALYRQKNGLSQQKLARLLSCSRSAVSAWEQGERMPGSVMFCKIAKALNVLPSKLLVH